MALNLYFFACGGHSNQDTRASRARRGGAAGSPPIPREDPCGLIETWVSFFGSLPMVQLLVERRMSHCSRPDLPIIEAS